MAALFLVCVATSGCASQSSYYGIDLGAQHENASINAIELQALARRATAGDKRAQLDLGIRFEEGSGVKRDLGKAESLYRTAASDSLKDVEYYQPGTSRISGRMVKLKAGYEEDGLSEARRRLERLMRNNQLKATKVGSCDCKESK